MVRFPKRKRKRAIPSFFLVLIFALYLPGIASANINYARKTGKPCGYCHIKIGGGGKLTTQGEMFRNHGYTLPPGDRSSEFPGWVLLTMGGGILVAGLSAFILWKKSRERD